MAENRSILKRPATVRKNFGEPLRASNWATDHFINAPLWWVTVYAIVVSADTGLVGYNGPERSLRWESL